MPHTHTHTRLQVFSQYTSGHYNSSTHTWTRMSLSRAQTCTKAQASPQIQSSCTTLHRLRYQPPSAYDLSYMQFSSHPSTKFRRNYFSSLCEILLTNQLELFYSRCVLISEGGGPAVTLLLQVWLQLWCSRFKPCMKQQQQFPTECYRVLMFNMMLSQQLVNQSPNWRCCIIQSLYRPCVLDWPRQLQTDYLELLFVQSVQDVWICQKQKFINDPDELEDPILPGRQRSPNTSRLLAFTPLWLSILSCEGETHIWHSALVSTATVFTSHIIATDGRGEVLRCVILGHFRSCLLLFMLCFGWENQYHMIICT